MSIDFTDRTTAGRAGLAGGALGRAVFAALRAPSVFNAQPWRWRLHDQIAELHANRSRQLRTLDAEGRLLTLSCGAALHHAVTALAAHGRVPLVERRPDPAHPDLLAVLRAGDERQPAPDDLRAYQALLARRTDRRPSAASTAVPAELLSALRDAAEAQHAHLHLLRGEEVAVLNVAVARAAEVELTDPGYLDDLATWTHRRPEQHDGVPLDTAVLPVPRRVPIRDFAPGGGAGLAPGAGTDRHASYAILFTDTDTPAAWLAAGEALSAVMITATGHGVAVNPISDVVEVPTARQVLESILAGIGHPMLALRLTVHERRPLPTAPRRTAEQVIEIR